MQGSHAKLYKRLRSEQENINSWLGEIGSLEISLHNGVTPENLDGANRLLVLRGRVAEAIKDRGPAGLVILVLLDMLRSIDEVKSTYSQKRSRRKDFEETDLNIGTAGEICLQEKFLERSVEYLQTDAIAKIPILDHQRFEDFCFGLLEIGKRIPILSDLGIGEIGYTYLKDVSTCQGIKNLLFRRRSSEARKKAWAEIAAKKSKIQSLKKRDPLIDDALQYADDLWAKGVRMLNNHMALWLILEVPRFNGLDKDHLKKELRPIAAKYDRVAGLPGGKDHAE